MAPARSRPSSGCATRTRARSPTWSPRWTSPRAPGDRLPRGRRRAAVGHGRCTWPPRSWAWPRPGWRPSSSQRAVFRLREDVEHKLARLPLAYFDKQSRGEVLSRATNDIDNIQQTLQQTLSQIMASLLTIVGVLVDDVLDLAAAGAGGADHRPGLGVGDDAHRQARPAAVRRPVEDHGQAQRPYRGDVHRPCAGEGLSGGRRSPRRRSGSRTTGSTGRASGPSSSPA